MWISFKDNNGVIIDCNDNEYYFDISNNINFHDLKRNDRVIFEYSMLLPDKILVAKNIKFE